MAASVARRMGLALALALCLAVLAPAGALAGLGEDQVGRVKALCLTGDTNGNLSGAQINAVTCVADLAALRRQSFSPDELVRLRYGDYTVIDPSTPPGQVGVAGYLLDAEMAQSARNAAACLGTVPAAYALRAPVGYWDALFSFDVVPYIAAGPSAGLAFAVAAYSALAGVPVCSEVAMTGEVTADGKVEAVGGVAYKLGAASSAGVGTVILPEGDRGDLGQVPAEVLQQVRLVFVSNAGQALFHALGPYGPQGQSYVALARRYADATALARQGELALADAEFAALQQVVPEDYSLTVWRDYLARAQSAAR